MKINNRKKLHRIFITILLIYFNVTSFPNAHSSSSLAIGDNGDGAIYGLDGNSVDNSGDFEDKLVIKGSGAAGGNHIVLFWDTVGEWNSSLGIGKIQTVEAFNNGSFQTSFYVPSTTNGTHYLWIQNANSNKFTISNPFYVYPRVKSDYIEYLPGETAFLHGYGFGPEKKIIFTIYNSTHKNSKEISRKSNMSGEFTSFFTLPKWDYGTYKLNISDIEGNYDLLDISLGPTIRFVRNGPVGAILDVFGEGFIPGSTITSNQVTFDNVQCNIIPDALKVTNQGSLVIKIIIPKEDLNWHNIQITDGINTASLGYKIDSTPRLLLSPNYGYPGQIINVKVKGLTQIENIATILVNGIKVSENKVISGAIVTNITLPAINLGEKYNLNVVDEYGVSATAKILVDYIDLNTDKTEYKSGSLVELYIVGFNSTNDGLGKIYLDGQETEAFSGGERYFTKTIYLPTLELGSHTITVEDLNNNIQLEKQINITETTKLTTYPKRGPTNRNVTVTVHNLLHRDNTETQWILFNKSFSIDISDRVLSGTPGQEARTRPNGAIDAWFNIPKTLSPGGYNLTCTTEYENTVQSATTQLIISNEFTSISTLKQEYHSGNQITFNLKTNKINNDSTLTVYSPDGNIHWIAELGPERWVQFRGNFTVMPSLQTTTNGIYLTIPQDSEGTWNWVYSNDVVNSINGSFWIVPQFILPTLIEVEKQLEKIDVNPLKIEVNKIHNITRTVKETTTILMSRIDEITNNIDNIINNIENTNNKIQIASDLMINIEIQKIEILLNYQIAIYASITAAYLIVFNKIYKWIVIELIIEE